MAHFMCIRLNELSDHLVYNKFYLLPMMP